MKNFLRKEDLLTILFLFISVIFLEGLVFSNQLNYGFRDVDWQVLYYFKLFGNLSSDHLLNEIKVLGVYASESYYVGLLESMLGLNFANLHLVTHGFKILAGISVYLLIFKIFKRKLLAFTTSVLYTISYTHAGVLFQLSSGGYFFTVIFMTLFFISYYNSLTKSNFIKFSLVSGLLLLITLLLKAERMYPLIATIFLTESFLLVKFKFHKDVIKAFVKRGFLIFLPLILFFLLYKFFIKDVVSGFAPNQFWIGINTRWESIMKGNIQLFLYPFASLGSIFLFEDYWKFLGQLNFQNITSFIISLTAGPILRLGMATFIILLFFYKRALQMTTVVMLQAFIFGLMIYILNNNWQKIENASKVHFDPNLISLPAILGAYILLMGIIFFIEWIKKKDLSLAPIVIGWFFASLFVLLTWIPSDLQLVFMGPQRYLSIPSIGIALFLSGIFIKIFDRLRTNKSTSNIAWMSFLPLFILAIINYQVAHKFFNYELTYAGVEAKEQIRMKNKFRRIVGSISEQDRSLFYFDESADKDNAYFNEGTTIAGFEYWSRVNADGSLNHFPDPGIIRTNHQCPGNTHQSCINILRKGLGEKDGKIGVWYADPIRGNINRFYPLNQIYGVRFVNKDIVDIRDEVLKELNFSQSP